MFEPGPGGGFGADAMPRVVLGPPGAASTTSSSLDVVSLGQGGRIVLGFGERVIVDGPGVDFVVFENAFWPGGQSAQVFAELAEVSVSEDGERFYAFECTPQSPSEPGRWPGCAGWTPTCTSAAADPADPSQLCGDGFDLAELPITRARFVAIRDLSVGAAVAPSAGFDLDAVGLVHYEPLR